MPWQLRAAIVISTALIIGAANHRYLAKRAATREFVAVTRSLNPGEVLASEDLMRIPLGGDLEALKETLLPWSEAKLFIGSPVTRSFLAGSLIVRRDVGLGDRVPTGEFLLNVELPVALGITKQFNIDSEVGFFISKRSVGGEQQEPYECGPFVLRRVGLISKPIDPNTLALANTGDVSLSVPKSPDGRIPAKAKELLAAINQDDGRRIIGLYDPRTK